jgi:hypothetical protein
MFPSVANDRVLTRWATEFVIADIGSVDAWRNAIGSDSRTKQEQATVGLISALARAGDSLSELDDLCACIALDAMNIGSDASERIGLYRDMFEWLGPARSTVIMTRVLARPMTYLDFYSLHDLLDPQQVPALRQIVVDQVLGPYSTPNSVTDFPSSMIQSLLQRCSQPARTEREKRVKASIRGGIAAVISKLPEWPAELDVWFSVLIAKDATEMYQMDKYVIAGVDKMPVDRLTALVNGDTAAAKPAIKAARWLARIPIQHRALVEALIVIVGQTALTKSTVEYFEKFVDNACHSASKKQLLAQLAPFIFEQQESAKMLQVMRKRLGADVVDKALEQT